MSIKKLLAAFFFIDFAALNVAALWFEGLGGMSEAIAGANLWTLVIAVDLVIVLAMVLTWLVKDARKQGRNPAGYVILTLMTGSLGPLLYVLLGDRASDSDAADARRGNEAELEATAA